MKPEQKLPELYEDFFETYHKIQKYKQANNLCDVKFLEFHFENLREEILEIRERYRKMHGEYPQINVDKS